jgi:ribosomal protein S18 acetylase RimI-like enzyme
VDESISLRPMLEDDVAAVIRVIDATDEDDAEEAEESYHNQGLDEQYVLTLNGAIIGVTGLRPIEGTDRRAWLSWTYMHPDYQGRGHGKTMMKELLEIAKGYDVHKLFVTTSDYIDPEDDEPLYQKAIELYLSMGFQEEFSIPDYFEPGESQLLYGLSLSDIDPVDIEPEEVILEFNHLGEIDETEGVYGIGWGAKKVGKFSFGKKKAGQFTAADCQVAIDRVKEWEGRAVLVTFPSNIPTIFEPLESAGFKEIGQLKDYYEDGLHKLYFWYKL